MERLGIKKASDRCRKEGIIGIEIARGLWAFKKLDKKNIYVIKIKNDFVEKRKQIKRR